MTPAQIQQILNAVKSSHRTTVKAMATTYSAQLTEEENSIIVAALEMLLKGEAAIRAEEREACAMVCDAQCAAHLALKGEAAEAAAAAIDDVSNMLRYR